MAERTATQPSCDDDRLPEPDFDWSWTEEESSWVAPPIDTSRPSAARIYDYALGGKDHFAVDREAAHRLLAVDPDAFTVMRDNRTFLLDAVQLMAQAGIRQFIDLGTGIPTSPSVLEIARKTVPDARVVYVDNDPIVLAHSRAILDGESGVVTLLHDLRDPATVLADPQLRELIDMEQPVGLLMTAVLHFVEQSIGARVVRHYIDRLTPGSHVAFSVATTDGLAAEQVREVENIYRNSTSPLTLRTLAQVQELLDGLHLLEPGLIDVSRWRRQGNAVRSNLRAGVGVKLLPGETLP